MTTPPKELSPERCHQLREGGFLRVLTNLLHEHTFENEDKPEADLNIEFFLMNFNRKAELRNRLSHQLRTIVEHTVKNKDELKILGCLETIRKYVGRLYNFIVGWKAMTANPSKLSDCIHQLTELAGQRSQVKEAIEELVDLTRDVAIHPIFEQFGGVFVIVDYLRAQTRFNARCHRFEPAQIDTSQLPRVSEDSKLVLRNAVTILYDLVFPIGSKDDIKLFLGNSRSLHEIMLGIVEDAYADNDLRFVLFYCRLLYHMYYTLPIGVTLSTSHLKDCGVIQCLAKFCKEIKDPPTLYYVLLALPSPLRLDRQNVLEFVSIDGAVDMLIDVVVPSKEKDEDVENAKWYEGQRNNSISALYYINRLFSTQDRFNIGERLLAIYESRHLVAILVRYLEQITSINEYPLITQSVLPLLWSILGFSEDQRQKFMEIGNGKEVVKRFESLDNELSARFSKEIGELFE